MTDMAQEIKHWICQMCKKVITTYVPLRNTPTCTNKHKPTEMEKYK